MTTKNIQILFPVVSLKAGTYHPAEFQPQGLMVSVDVPLDDEHVANCNDVGKEGEAEIFVTPVLTVDGLRWCYNKLQSAFVNEPATAKKDAAQEDTDDWE